LLAKPRNTRDFINTKGVGMKKLGALVLGLASYGQIDERPVAKEYAFVATDAHLLMPAARALVRKA
jgi:hypothetical protein